MRLLPFSTPTLRTHFVASAKDVSLTSTTIVFNAGTATVMVGQESLAPRTSSIFTHATIPSAKDVLLITSDHGFSALSPYPQSETLMREWVHVHNIFPLPHLKKTALWRSPQARIGNTSFNLWFAAAGTDCGIHNKHNFLEVHTQIWGTGHMQKFRENDASTLYQDIFMTPGYTHEPFCDADHLYPWHRYLADTDCLWLAAEYGK